MHTILRKVILFCYFFICLNSYADLISTVYRADSRAPEDVFKNGFVSWGNNINFYAHIDGASTAKKDKNSAFIATSSDEVVAKTYAYKRVIKGPDPTYYVYVIRATNNFYSAQVTMEHLCNLKSRTMGPELKRLLDWEKEYAALNYISPSQVQSVLIYKYVPNQGVKITTENNKNYDSKVTFANEGPYTGSDSYPLDIKPILFIGPPLLAASFQSDSKESYTSTPWPISVVLLNDEL